MALDDATLIEAFERHGTKKAAAEALGLKRRTYTDQLDAALKRRDTDPAVLDVMAEVGTNMVPSMVWLKTGDYSICLKPPKDTQEVDLREAVRETIEDALAGYKPGYEPRPVDDGGEHLLVVDCADVHFGKLAVKSETGYEYNRAAAHVRVVEGTKSLLRRGSATGIGRILFVLGDDALHIDNAKSTTTSGTPQDTEGSVFQMYRDAFVAFTEAISECAKVADVDLIHVPSNHDWILGWALSHAVAMFFKDHPNVHASTYSMSERHRKYYRFGSNLIGLSHGDGAKEQQLYACMVTEAREHISDCRNLYFLLHHVHHKIRKATGLKTELREKDHIGMTVICSAGEVSETDGPSIEYVRSPSPPDSWHDRNGFINRQAVECFMYHPQDGQTVRFTEYF